MSWSFILRKDELFCAENFHVQLLRVFCERRSLRHKAENFFSKMSVRFIKVSSLNNDPEMKKVFAPVR